MSGDGAANQGKINQQVYRYSITVIKTMAPITNVVVLTTHGRRVNIKVQPDTTLMKILEDVCNKFDFSVEDYDLKHHNKILDLTILMRFSGLPNNAGLEMCAAVKKRTESSVIVLVQLENGTRLTGHFVPSDSMWQVLSTLCNEELSAMESPVVIFTRTEINGEEKLKATSLRSLGLTGGRAMFRLLNRTEEQLRQQANVSAPLPRLPPPPSPPPREKTPKSDPPAKAQTISEPQPGPSSSTSDAAVPGPSWATDSPPPKKPMKEASKEQPEPKKKVVDPVEIERRQEMEKEVERELVLDPRLAPEEDLPNDFFELTLEDAKRLMRDLRRQREELEEQPIKTAAMRELEENKHQLAMLQKYKHTVIRIHFQDGLVLQAAFKPVESGEAIYNFVRLIEVGCVPGAVVHFSTTAHSAPFLQEQLQEKLSSPAAALLAARRSKTS
ncbi:hypothetical protein B566_EDAN009147 [Ephemera danica]|nr:hypothetical protein B566_EDAN009147 [Ephemera danica]